MKVRFMISIFLYLFLFFSFKSQAQELILSQPLMEGFDLREHPIDQRYLESLWWPWGDSKSTKLNPFRIENLIGLEKKLQQRIIGQDQAIRATVSALERYGYGLHDPYAPLACLLYVGPTGVGKTQLAKELANLLLEDEQSFIRLNMSEYADYSGVYRLIGPPVGYSGYEQGGILTEALKKNPYAIVLLDEFEKASPYVLKIFLQIFDEGVIVPPKGKAIDCRNMLFILTSNLESQKILTMNNLGNKDKEILAAIQPTLMNALSPELYNRIEPVIFRGFKESQLDLLIQNLLLQTTEGLAVQKQLSIDFEQSVIQFLKMSATNYQLGARPFKHKIKQTILVALIEAIKEGYIQQGDCIVVNFQEGNFIIQNLKKENFFIWQLIEEEQETQSPFKLENIVDLEKKLQQRIVGQDQAIKTTVSALERYVYGLNSVNSPLASLLYIGPTGVGKTQLAKELARLLMGREEDLVHLNMSEYSTEGSISRLVGSPPGYVNHEEGGQLTEALKQHPYAIVLLDEIEKASPAILKLFLQVFDEGKISDAKGNVIDCRNVMFILTTNLESQKILTMHDLGHSDQEIVEAIQPTLMKTLSPELYNRLDPVIFRGFKDNILDELIQNLLMNATEDLSIKKQIFFHFEPSIIQFLKMNATNYQLGARPFKHQIKQVILHVVTEALKQGYLQLGDEARMSFENDNFIIENLREAPFLWSWSEEKQGIQPPFQLQDLLQLESKLQKRVLGQPYAIKITVAALMRYSAGLSGTKSPIGSFLYVGPTGVGKTQLAKELAIELMGSDNHLIRLDMSEYSEAHSISRLIGSPPGYVNHEEGGQLTEALKQHPYAIVLLDEIEKAHPVVLKTFLQVFDEGRLSDSKGTMIDCRNIIFIATTNLASAKILRMQEEGYRDQEILESIQPDIKKNLSPELYNRLEVATFMGLSSELMNQLIQNMLKEVQDQILERKMVQVQFDASLIQFLKQNGYDYELGARPLKRLIQQMVVTSIAKEILEGNIQPGDTIKLFYRNSVVLIKKEL